jgi:hypothetical protein
VNHSSKHGTPIPKGVQPKCPETRAFRIYPRNTPLPSRAPDYDGLVLDNVLLGAFLIFGPLAMAATAYAFMWGILCLVRFMPLIGRKHRHSDWEQLNT